MKNLLKNKLFIGCAAAILVTVITVTAVLLLPGDKPNPVPDNPNGTSDVTVEPVNPDVSEPPVTPSLPTDEPSQSVEPDDKPPVNEIKVDGEPDEEPAVTEPPKIEDNQQKEDNKPIETPTEPDKDKTEQGTKSAEDIKPEEPDELVKEDDEKHEIPSDDKEKPVSTGEESKTEEEVTKPDVIVGDDNPGAPVFTPPTGGENPFDKGVTPEIDDKPVEDYIEPEEGRPGEGVHF